MASLATWWFVMIRPLGDTNEPDPPLLKRMDDFCTCSSQAADGSKLCLSCNSLRGGLVNSHMPSSAEAFGSSMAGKPSATTRAARIVDDIVRLLLSERRPLTLP